MSCGSGGKLAFEPKDPDARLDYIFDWTEWLGTAGDVITLHEVLVSSPELVVESAFHDDTTVTIWLTGGVVYKVYSVTCRIHTSAGRFNDRTAQLPIAQR